VGVSHRVRTACGNCCIPSFAAGTGNPFFTTDTAAALRGRESEPSGPIGFAHRVELGANLGGFTRIEAGIEDGFRRLGDHARDIEEECGERGGDA
jgi:hypothetical protein